MDKLKLSFAEIADTCGESTHTVYAAIAAGHLQTFLVGRRRFARPEAVRKWIDFLESQSNAGSPVVYRPRSGEKTAA